MISSAVVAGLSSSGIDCINIGIVSTPAVSVMLRELKCSGGVVITASHNPVEYNGIKLLLDNGIAPPTKDAGQVQKLFYEKIFSPVASIDCGKIIENKKAAQVHIEKVLSIVDAKKISEKNYKVVLDSVNGAGVAEGRLLLYKLGCGLKR